MTYPSENRTQGAGIDAIVDACVSVLAESPSGLMTDIDGTISAIAAAPTSAFVSDRARAALAELTGVLDLVATVSGRGAANAESMVDVPGLVYIGNHGMERRSGGATTVHPDAVFAAGEISAALAAIERKAVRLGISEGIIYENKGVTGSVHYRLSPDRETAKSSLLEIIRPEAESRGLRATEGRMVIELRPAVAIDKGSALRAVVGECGLRGLVFLGDDTTDLDAMRALISLRADGTLNGLNIAVIAPESSPEMARAADFTVEGVDECIDLLTRLAGRLSTRSKE